MGTNIKLPFMKFEFGCSRIVQSNMYHGEETSGSACSVAHVFK